jgi:hypothetical protein
LANIFEVVSPFHIEVGSEGFAKCPEVTAAEFHQCLMLYRTELLFSYSKLLPKRSFGLYFVSQLFHLPVLLAIKKRAVCNRLS